MRRPLLLSVSQLEDRSTPAITFTVDTFADTFAADLNGTTGLDATGKTSLRSAVTAANNLAGMNTIKVPAGTYLLAHGQIDIQGRSNPDDLTFERTGNGNAVLDGQGKSRILQVATNNALSLSGFA